MFSRGNRESSRVARAASSRGVPETRPHRSGLRIKLLIGALVLGTLPLLVASIILPLRVKSTLTALGHEHLRQVARDLATLTQNEVQRHLETVRSFAAVAALRDAVFRHNSGALDESELAATNRQIGSMLHGLAANQYQGMFLCGSDGIIFAGMLKSGETQPYANLDIRDRAYLQQARESLQPVVSDPLRSKVGNVPIIVIAVPILDRAGAFAGIVGLSIEIEHLAASISSQKLGETGYPFAIDRHGILVAHPDPERQSSLNLGQVPGATRLAERMMRGETGVESYVSSKGADKIAAFAPVPVTGWSVAASIETAEFGAPAQSLRRIIFAMIGACIVVAIIVAIAFALGLEKLNLALTEARASEARFKLFASVANGAIWDWNLQTGELWWNAGLTAAFGYARDEIEPDGAALENRLPPDEREQVMTAIRGSFAGGPWSGEHHFLRQDGTAAYVLHHTVAVRDAAGVAVRAIGGITDISARRAAERKLAEQAALLDQTRDGILVRDLDQVIRYWNRGAEELYGWTAGEATGRRADELLQIDAQTFAEASRLVLENGEWFGHLTKKTKGGNELTLDCRWTLLRDERGRPRSILSIDTDITERRLMEAKFLRAQRLESIGTLAGGIAHDLNNLLAPIIVGVDMLRQPDAGGQNMEIIRLIEQSANRGSHLVRQVLSFARGIDGARVSVHIGYVAREVQEIMQSTFPKNITIRVNVPKDAWLVTADPTQLNQVLVNLCVNARDAMPGGGRLTIAAENVRLDEHFALMNQGISAGRYLLIEVSDTGAGMAPEVLEKIFEPFFTTKEAGKGTGLGLSTVIGIVRSHGGTVNVYSEPDKGSTFKIYLPASPETPAAAATSGPAKPPADGRGRLILLVDDEPPILNLTKRTLESFGYRVLIACDGAQAFALYNMHREEIALVLTDMMMPVMDGAALIGALRRVDPDVIVVAASGLHDNNNQIKAAEVEIKHFLCKPYTTASLLTKIQNALAEKNPEAAPAPQPDPQPILL